MEKIVEFNGVLKAAGAPEALSDGESAALATLVPLLADIGRYHVSTLSAAMVAVSSCSIDPLFVAAVAVGPMTSPNSIVLSGYRSFVRLFPKRSPVAQIECRMEPVISNSYGSTPLHCCSSPGDHQAVWLAQRPAVPRVGPAAGGHFPP